MIDLVDVGRLALGLGFGAAAFQLVAASLAILRRTPELALSARNAAAVTALLLTTATATLSAGFLSRDFGVAFVADHSSRAMPLGLTIAALWGGQEGSLLFWTWMLGLFSAVAAHRMLRHEAQLGAWGLATLAAVQLFFLAVLVYASSPFQRLVVSPDDGRGLNPLLWDSGMQIHPPMLLTGYMSFTIPFAFAAAILLSGRLTQGWLREMRNWMLLAWAIQSAGLLLGAWWAYRVLGWGGYWGWDPVENVALLPWLVATAFLHSALAQERRGQLRAWSIGLVLTAFVLAVFGTFVVRSGILTSVHSFALSDVGPIFLVFVGIVAIGSAALFLFRFPLLRSPSPITSLASKEGAFLLNNLLLISVAVTTFWGTVYPVVTEIFQGARISVGPPFYARVNVPLMLVLLGLLGVGPLLAWRRTSLPAVLRATRWPLLTALAVSALVAALGMRDGLGILGLALAAAVAGGVIVEYGRSIRAGWRSGGAGRARAVLELMAGSRRRLGSYIVHLGVAVFAIGVIGSIAFKQETVATLAPGESARVGAYELTYRGLTSVSTPGLTTVTAALEMTENGQPVDQLGPQRRVHRGWENQPTSDVAISTTLPRFDDVYVVLTNWDNERQTATFRLLVNPLVAFLWIGGLVYFAGVLVVAWPARAREQQRAPLPSAAGQPAHS